MPSPLIVLARRAGIRKERDQAQKSIEQLDEALKALTGLGGSRRKGVTRSSGKRRTMSAASKNIVTDTARDRQQMSMIPFPIHVMQSAGLKPNS